jgi:hypothetical protein
MDEHTRQILNEAIALDDQCRASYEAMETRNAEQARHDEYVERGAPGNLLYRTTVTPRPAQAAPAIDERLDAIVEIIGEEVGAEHKKLYAESLSLVRKMKLISGVAFHSLSQPRKRSTVFVSHGRRPQLFSGRLSLLLIARSNVRFRG